MMGKNLGFWMPMTAPFVFTAVSFVCLVAYWYTRCGAAAAATAAPPPAHANATALLLLSSLLQLLPLLLPPRL